MNEPTDVKMATARLLRNLLGSQAEGGRAALNASLRQKHAELEPLKSAMSKDARERFDEIGVLLELLAESGNKRP